MIPLASDLLPFPDQMRREGHLKLAGPPDLLSSSGRITILRTTLIFRSCREVIAVPVDKIAWRCKQATERRWLMTYARPSPAPSVTCERRLGSFGAQLFGRGALVGR